MSKAVMKQVAAFMHRHMSKVHRQARRHGHAPAIVAGKPKQQRRKPG